MMKSGMRRCCKTPRGSGSHSQRCVNRRGRVESFNLSNPDAMIDRNGLPCEICEREVPADRLKLTMGVFACADCHKRQEMSKVDCRGE